MRSYTIREATELYRRSGTVRRTLTLAPLVPSQDVSRYQAVHMSSLRCGLDHKETCAPIVTNPVRRLAVMAIGAGTVLIQRMGTWLPGHGWGVPDLT